jgi:uncharacterized protein (UPF0276 family)
VALATTRDGREARAAHRDRTSRFGRKSERRPISGQLIEWDANVPDWRTLHAKAERAEAILRDIGARVGMAAVR